MRPPKTPPWEYYSHPVLQAFLAGQKAHSKTRPYHDQPYVGITFRQAFNDGVANPHLPTTAPKLP